MERQAQTEASQKKHFVLNASVSLLWFLRDEPPDLCSKADLLFQDILDGKVIVHVPDRWLDEVCGGLVKAVHAKRLTLNEARDALRRVFRMISLPNWHVHYSDCIGVTKKSLSGRWLQALVFTMPSICSWLKALTGCFGLLTENFTNF